MKPSLTSNTSSTPRLSCTCRHSSIVMPAVSTPPPCLHQTRKIAKRTKVASDETTELHFYTGHCPPVATNGSVPARVWCTTGPCFLKGSQAIENCHVENLEESFFYFLIKACRCDSVRFSCSPTSTAES